MKKIILLTQVVVLLFFLAKIAALGEVMKKPEVVPFTPGSFMRYEPDIAAQADLAKLNKTPRDEVKVTKVRDMLTALESKRVALEKKEQYLSGEEQRLLLLKKEIVEKIDTLRTQEEKSLAAAELQNSADNKRFKDLAKVYEATPAAKAGVMLEQLDVKTAAGITMNMKKEKAGAIWGYLSPQKAVKITFEITRLEKQETK